MRIRRFLCVLLALIGLCSLTNAKQTKQYQVTVGKSVTIDPAVDLGVDYDQVTFVSGMLQEGNTSYAYVTSNFTYERVAYDGGWDSSGEQKEGYKYIITPQKAGLSTFLINVNWRYYHNNAYYNESIVYTIYAVDVTKISLDYESLTLTKGEYRYITPTIDSPLAETTLSWTSSDNSVATVNQNGRVSAVSIGTTTIKCRATNGVSAQCTVTVKANLVESLTMNESSCKMAAGDTHQLSVTVLPDNATDKSVTWSSTNESVAVVNDDGLVTAVGSGTCQIKATANDGSGKTASCTVAVTFNQLYCNDFEATPEAVVNLPILLTNGDAIQGFDFKLALPVGIRVVAKHSQYTATLTDRVGTEGLECTRLSGNIYQFTYSSTNRILGNSGAIVNVPLVVASDMAAGTYAAMVKDVQLVTYGTSEQISTSESSATVIIKENASVSGDVNGDGAVDIGDIVAIIDLMTK